MPHSSSPRFTLRQMVVMVTLFALGMIAMTQSSLLWLSVIATATFVMFLTAIVAAIFYPGRTRAFWIGFCVWGMAYLVMVGVVLKDENVRPSLVTTKFLRTLFSAVVREVPVTSQTGGGGFGGGGFGGGGFGGGGFGGANTGGGAFVPKAYVPSHDVFMPVGQLMWSWLFALVGGYVAQACCQHGMHIADAHRNSNKK